MTGRLMRVGLLHGEPGRGGLPRERVDGLDVPGDLRGEGRVTHAVWGSHEF